MSDLISGQALRPGKSIAQRERSSSRSPDLLFEDQREARLQEIRLLFDHPESITETFPLHRVTVFLTYRCNLACPYCKTIVRSPGELHQQPQKCVTFSDHDFRRLLESYGSTPIRHLHFTGGEAALVRDLPLMVRLARERGVESLSITSNGTLPPNHYLTLVESGMDEIRISLDAADPALGETLTLRKRAWQSTVLTIKALSAARRRGARFFLIINTVIGLRNRHRLPAILRFLLELGPDDLKLITEVDEKERLGNFGEVSQVLAESRDLLAAYPAEAFPLLRRKLQTVFTRDAIGLEGIPPDKDNWRCYIPLTERTVDGLYYYPCSVYLREGGSPLGKIEESQSVQRSQSASFVRRADCLRDSLCRRYCLHCTQQYNIRANEERW